jgi:hypothetical protein
VLLSSRELRDDTVFFYYQTESNLYCNYCNHDDNHDSSKIPKVEKDDKFEPKDDEEEEEITEAIWLLAKKLPTRQ